MSDEKSQFDMDGPQNWPEDYSLENGEYSCHCRQCGVMFIGHKRRSTCKKCFIAEVVAQRDNLQKRVDELGSALSDIRDFGMTMTKEHIVAIAEKTLEIKT